MKSINIKDRKITPSKIVCVGRNYVEHIRELENEIPDQILIFMKYNSAISNELLSYHQEQLSYEGELCFLYENNRFSAIGFGLDLTKRQLQSTLKSKGLPWERAKSFDGSAVFSDFTEISDNDTNLSFSLDINGKPTQFGQIDLMINKPEQILEEIRTFISLNDGDIVMTGSPKGVGVIQKDDLFKAKVMINDEVVTSAKWVAR